MLSPKTGKPMKLVVQKRVLEFRKHEFEVLYHTLASAESGEEFTTTELDELNVSQVYNQYRSRFNIPFPEEIRQIRAKYEISATKMSQILGLGINSYRQYESGEIPSISNARLIQLASKPENFIDMINSAEDLTESDRAKFRQRVQNTQKQEQGSSSEEHIKNYLLGDEHASIYTGYRKPDLDKLSEMIKFFSEKCEPYKTKLNKLLFYADFHMFKRKCHSMSGLRYRAIQMGPVPNNYQSIFEFLQNNNQIETESVLFPTGYSGERYLTKKLTPFDSSKFNDDELAVLNDIVAKYGDSSTEKLIEDSHAERAWLENIDKKKFISYDFAFYMN
jgi:uncharacterized phage-associated protein/DNA-binding transcriptional regulator YiaG